MKQHILNCYCAGSVKSVLNLSSTKPNLRDYSHGSGNLVLFLRHTVLYSRLGYYHLSSQCVLDGQLPIKKRITLSSLSLMNVWVR